MNGSGHRRFIVLVNMIPTLAVPVGIWLLATRRTTWLDIGLLVGMFIVAGLGISVAYHRLLSHRSFTTSRPLRVALVTAGAVAGQGPPLIWVAHHRRHHRHADAPGDPHSPYVDQPSLLRGIVHSHVGWLFNENLASDPIRYCPDLARDRDVRFLSRHFGTIVLIGLLVPGVVAFAVTGGDVTALLAGILWGGLIRLFLSNQITWAVNSFGHVTGSRPFPTSDESRNNWWLAIPSFGEAWHNGHHAFPRSYRHGLRNHQIDISAMLIWSLEKVGLAHDVVRIDSAAQGEYIEAHKDRAGGRRQYEHVAPVPMAARKGVSTVGITDVD